MGQLLKEGPQEPNPTSSFPSFFPSFISPFVSHHMIIFPLFAYVCLSSQLASCLSPLYSTALGSLFQLLL